MALFCKVNQQPIPIMTQATEVKTPLTIASLISDYVVYNEWANKRLVEWLQTKPSGLMELEVPSSFPGIKGTLVHIWDTQRFWLAVLQQVEAPASFRQFGFYGTLDEAFDGLIDQSKEFAAYVKSLTDAELQEEVILKTPWADGVEPRMSFIQHCMNHSTYHRGQLITIGHTIGLKDAPMTDYNFYRLIG
jgi:uncharacterized damage-inducible protein DinB